MIINKINVTLIQSKLEWEDKSKNLENFDSILSGLETDIVVLPEMFTTGFSMSPEKLAETMDGESVGWMIKRSKELNAVICGSLIIEENQKYYNRFIWTEPDGKIITYDKRHLFGYAGEDKHYTPGQQRVIIEYKGWKILPLVCYDLRFPVWSRNVDGYDLIICVANWPRVRRHAWKTLLQARAIENQSFVVGVNRVGLDGKGNDYSGNSMIVYPLGEVMYELSEDETHQINLIKELVDSQRESLPFLKDQDKFNII